MDDVNMGDDSSPSGSLPSQRFNIADMLSEGNRATFDSISGALMASATTDAASIGSSLSAGSIYYEEDDALIMQRLQKMYPYLDLKKDPLPRYWNSNNKMSTLLSISLDFLRVQYKGKTTHRNERNENKDITLVRANRPIPNMAVVYYFEIYIVSKDVDGSVSIGLTDKSVAINRLPGWDEHSYGYHGDDGNFFSHASNGQIYGPSYTTGDVVGCGLNFITQELFFTKNGISLGVATQNIKDSDRLYPTVGMHTSGVVIDANFGQKPFKYNILEYMQEAHSFVAATIRSMELPSEKAIWMNRTVMMWLEHEGYSRALNAFSEATGITTDTSADSSFTNAGEASTLGGGNLAPVGGGAITRRSEEMEHRRAIMRMIQVGRVADAIKEVDRLFPALLTTNRELSLLLKVQQYVEMIAEMARENASKNSLPSTLTDFLSSDSTTDVASTSTFMSFGYSGSSKRSSMAPYSVENGRSNLKRRSSEDREIRQTARRFPYQHHNTSTVVAAPSSEQQQRVAFSPARSNVSNAALSDFDVTAPTTLDSNSQAFSNNASNNNFENSSNSHELMDTGYPGRGFDDGGRDKLEVTNGNSTPVSSTNGCPVVVEGSTPPTSTTIVEEFEETNNVWEDTASPSGANDANLYDAGSDAAYENGAAIVENYQHLQKYLPLIEFGHSISQLAQQLPSNLNTPKLLTRMNHAFSLIGYLDPLQSNNSYLLTQRERNFVAKALKRAILDFLGKERYTQLDLYIRKTRLDRQRYLALSTAIYFADVDKLLFSQTPSANTLNFCPQTRSANGRNLELGKTGATDFSQTLSSFDATTPRMDDDNSNSSGGSSSMGAGGVSFDSK